MHIKVKDACIQGIYIFVIFSAITYMQYTLGEPIFWKRLYMYSIYMVVGFSFLFFILVLLDRYVEISICPSVLLFILIYQIIVSAFNQLLYAVPFIIDGIPWLCVTVSFYYYSSQNDIPRSFKPISIFSLIVICLLSIPNIIKHDGNSLFSTYYCLTFLPILYFSTSKRTSLTFSFIICLLMLFTLKRGGFTISVIGVLIYSILLLHNEQMPGKKIRMLVIIALAIWATFILGYIIITKMNLTIIDRMNSLLEDQGSGRVPIWEEILQKFSMSSTSEKWFGHGFHAVFYRVQPVGIARYAHNSWIEILYDYGIIGLSLMVVFTFSIIITTIRLIWKKAYLAPILGYTLVPMIILSSGSYFFEESTVILPLCIVWGICLGKVSRGEQKETQELDQIEEGWKEMRRKTYKYIRA